jgi:hypothetical protein
MFNFRIWLETHTMIVKGIQFIAPPGNKVLLLGDIAKIDQSFVKDTGFYVGPNGENSIPGRYEGFQEFLKKGIPIEAPQVSIWKNEIGFNGRHRFSVFRDKGFKAMPFAVSKDQVHKFNKLYAANNADNA